MITFKYKKFENATFVSHIDVLRIINRTLRRMGIDAERSKGFNPRALINLSQPLPLGVHSDAEWATVQTDFSDTKEFVRLFNEYCPKGIEVVSCYCTMKKPNIAGKVVATDYIINNINSETLDIVDIKTKPFIITAKTKSGMQEKDISSYIYRLDMQKDNQMYLMLPFGNVNIRIDNFIEKLNKDFGKDISVGDTVRLNQYIKENDAYTKVDDYIQGLE